MSIHEGHYDPVGMWVMDGCFSAVSATRRRIGTLEVQDLIELNYRDYLQAPLQPLQDDLESQTYETFEKDVTKYTTYEEAVRRALLDRVPEAEAETKTTVVMVVGAGEDCVCGSNCGETPYHLLVTRWISTPAL